MKKKNSYFIVNCREIIFVSLNRLLDRKYHVQRSIDWLIPAAPIDLQAWRCAHSLRIIGIEKHNTGLCNLFNIYPQKRTNRIYSRGDWFLSVSRHLTSFQFDSIAFYFFSWLYNMRYKIVKNTRRVIDWILVLLCCLSRLRSNQIIVNLFIYFFIFFCPLI